jgi:hypothetical protein
MLVSVGVTHPARFRAHARRKVRLRVVVWHPRAGWQREAEIGDLSLGGGCLLSHETLAVGDGLTISFVAPTLWDPLQMQARVAWVAPATHREPARAGLAFTPKDAANAMALYELMTTLGG